MCLFVIVSLMGGPIVHWLGFWTGVKAKGGSWMQNGCQYSIMIVLLMYGPIVQWLGVSGMFPDWIIVLSMASDNPTRFLILLLTSEWFVYITMIQWKVMERGYLIKIKQKHAPLKWENNYA
jgi:hypothetical protein